MKRSSNEVAHIKSSIACNGERISTLRKAKGWTREDLARAAGVSERTLGSMETGKRATILTVSCVAEALGVAPDDITANVETVESTKPRASLCVTFNLTFQETDEDSLIEALEGLIKRLTGSSGNVAFNAVIEGSVMVMIELDWDAAVDLVALEGRLQAIHITIGMRAKLVHAEDEAAFHAQVAKRRRKPIKLEDISLEVRKEPE